MTILQTPTPCKLLKTDILRPRYPQGGYPSLHDRQNIPRPNRIPHNHRHPNHASALRRLQLILHLHRLNHHDSLAFHHLLTSIHQHAHPTSRHGSLHRPRPLRPGPTTPPPLQRPRIIHLKPKPSPANQNPIPIQNAPVLSPLPQQRHHARLQPPHIPHHRHPS